MIRLRTGKRPGAGRTPKPVSLSTTPARRTRFVERHVAARIFDVEAGGDDTDRGAAGAERSVVHGAVDADRHPAHDRDTGHREECTELVRIGETVGCRAPSADDRNPRLGQRVGAAPFGEQDGRAVRDVVGDGVHRCAFEPHRSPALLDPAGDPA